MIYTIGTRLFDILQNDSRLLTIYNSTNFPAVKRCKLGTQFNGTDANQNPIAGAVNLYDWTYELNDTGMLPGVYLGMKGFECTDAPDSGPVIAGNLIEFRLATVPIVIVVNNSDKNLASK